MFICITVTGHGRMPATYVFDKDEVTLGRSSRNDVVFDPKLDGAVSRHHAVLKRCPDWGWTITDLNSTQGTYVNNQQVEGTSPLDPRDSIVLGINGPRLRVSFERSPDSNAQSTTLVRQPTVIQFPLGLYHGFPERFYYFQKVGEGGYGQVWRAHPRGEEDVVAVKFLRPELLANESTTAFLRSSKAVARFRREGDLMRRLGESGAPGIARIHEAGGDEDEGFLYLIMEYIEGKSLDRFVSARQRLKESTVCGLLREVAESLDAAHNYEWVDESGHQMRGIVHRDVKPSNIILREADQRAILCDFGIAAIQEGGERLTLPATRISSHKYTAPEVLISNAISPASDLWGLAVTGYVLLTGGFFPYGGMGLGQTLRAIRDGELVKLSRYRSDISPPLENFLLEALDADPSRRPDSARAWADWLTDFQPAE